MQFAIEQLIKPPVNTRAGNKKNCPTPRKSKLEPMVAGVIPTSSETAMNSDSIGDLCGLSGKQVTNTLYVMRRKGATIGKRLIGAGNWGFWMEGA